jgi:hypothetical protein
MNHRQRFLEIHEFLKPYQRIWQNEIMLLYPEPFQDYPMEWVEELAGFHEKADLIELEKKNVAHLIKGACLRSFYQRIEELSAVPKISEYPAMPENNSTWLYIIPKKQYEIKTLAPLVNAYYESKKIKRIIDIGGGIGLLAQTLNNQYGLKVTTLDMDPVLQKTGSTRHEKNARNPENKVSYYNVQVDTHEPEFRKLLEPENMTLGLHTCGTLANHQIISSAENKLPLIINFGCCYHKLEHIQGSENISALAQSLPDKIEMSHFALTLSARAHRKMDDKDYDLKLKVKLYRYGIHFLLRDEYGYPGLVTLGNSSPALYDESFGTYVLEQLKRINQKPLHTKEELDQYFDEKARKDLIWKMIAAGLIRNAFGRLLELYILLDRVCYLEEQGYEVKLMEFFNESLSPRNLGIVATY